MLGVTGGRAPPDVAGRVESMMLMEGGRIGRLDQPSLEVKPRCRIQRLANRTTTWHTKDSDLALRATSLAKWTQHAM